MTIIISFASDAWISISDNNEKEIAYGVKRAVRSIEVKGTPPFRVILDVSKVVSINYDGELVDLSHLEEGRAARFALPIRTNLER